MDEKLKVIKFPEQLSELQKALVVLRQNLNMMIEYEEIRAKIIRAKYNFLIAEGFTKEEALELCKEGVK